MKISLSLPLRATAVALACAAATPAVAASDYLLEIDDYAGPGQPGTIEVQSWSWGMSKPNSAGIAASTARVSQPLPSHGNLYVVTAHEAGSGMATGRRCAAGVHFPKATLRGPRQTVSLTDVTISACAADGMTISYGSAHPAPAAPAASTVVKSKSNITNN